MRQIIVRVGKFFLIEIFKLSSRNVLILEMMTDLRVFNNNSIEKEYVVSQSLWYMNLQLYLWKISFSWVFVSFFSSSFFSLWYILVNLLFVSMEWKISFSWLSFLFSRMIISNLFRITWHSNDANVSLKISSKRVSSVVDDKLISFSWVFVSSLFFLGW